mmetsp:Transcript_5993/g.16836  ORF Transcript_5993/g.16836 Transcript_5993/m.16836 type:complete len:81 (-) Transcript_5993:2147-2389(-)
MCRSSSQEIPRIAEMLTCCDAMVLMVQVELPRALASTSSGAIAISKLEIAWSSPPLQTRKFMTDVPESTQSADRQFVPIE